MERTIQIDGRDVKFRSSGAFPMIYRANTGRDLFADLVKISESAGDGEISFDTFDSQILEDVIWCLAKCADKGVQGKIDWFDTFDVFPIFEVFGQLNELVMTTMQTSKKA